MSAPAAIKATGPESEVPARERVQFDFQEAGLHPDANTYLDKVAALMRERPDTIAIIEGHTDDRGGRRVNLALSEVRALVVMKALVDRGVPRGQLRAVGHGIDRPIADNQTEEGRRLNRRTEVVIVDRGAEPGAAVAANPAATRKRR